MFVRYSNSISYILAAEHQNARRKQYMTHRKKLPEINNNTAVKRWYVKVMKSSKAFVRCREGKHTLASSRTLLEDHLRRKYIKRISFYVYYKCVSNNWYFPQPCPAQPLLLDLYQKHYGLNFNPSTAKFQIVVRHKRNLLQNIDITEQEQYIWVQH